MLILKSSIAAVVYFTFLNIVLTTAVYAQTTNTTATRSSMAGPQVKWFQIDLPLEVDTLFVKDDILMGFGTDEFGTISAGKFTTLGKHKIGKSYRFDGRVLSGIKSGLGECVPTYAAFTNGFFYIRSECDHGGQILRVDPAKSRANRSIYISYRAEDHRSGLIVGPADSVECNGKYLIPAYNDKAVSIPVLLTPNYAKPSFETVWEGSKQTGTIAAAACAEGRGWLAMVDGTLLKNESTTKRDWHFAAKLPDVGGEIKSLKFVNKYKGYLIRKNAAYLSTNGGRTWERLVTISEDEYRSIVFDDEWTAISGTKGIYLTKGDAAFTTIDLPGGSPPNSLVIFGDMIFAVSRGNVYTAKLPF